MESLTIAGQDNKVFYDIVKRMVISYQDRGELEKLICEKEGVEMSPLLTKIKGANYLLPK